MENKVNAKIKELINRIYGGMFSDAQLNALLENIGKAASVITETRKTGWDENDVVLITYADQFSAEGGRHFLFLHVFIINGFLLLFLTSIFYLFIHGLRTTVFLSLIIMKLHLKQEHGETLPN